MWLAMKLAAAADQVEIFGSALDDAMPFGARIVVHATSRGPRQAAAISESLVDGTIATFHARVSTDAAAAVAAALVPRLPGIDKTEIAALAAIRSPRLLFATSR